MKEIYILKPYTYEVLDVIDTIESLMWTERWRGYGEFEILTTVDVVKKHPELIKKENLVWIETGKCFDYTDAGASNYSLTWDTLMIIEDIKTTYSASEGNMIYIRGRSLEAYLTRRIVAGHRTFVEKTAARLIIHRLLLDNFLDMTGYPTNEGRVFRCTENVISFMASYDRTMKIKDGEEIEFFGENLYDAIMGVCKEYDWGFRITPVYNPDYWYEPDIALGMTCRIVSTTDRSMDQTINQPIIFSQSYNNIKSMLLDDSDIEYKNYAFTVGAEPEESSGEKRVEEWVRPYVYYKDSDPDIDKKVYTQGDRREMFVDSSSVSRTYTPAGATEPVTSSYQSYTRQVIANARKELQKEKKVLDFDSEVEPYVQYEYNKDYTIGNLVSIEDMFGNYHTVRITEVTRAWDRNGYSVMPMFENYDLDKTET